MNLMLTRRKVKAGVFAALAWAVPGAVQAQAPAVVQQPAGVVIMQVTPGAQPGVTYSPAVEVADQGTPVADGNEAGPASPWAKVPAISPPPRPGWFILPPAGEGYYSALDALVDRPREKAPVSPYRTILGSFFDNDFRYLDKGQEPVDFFDRLKRMPLWASDSCWGHNLELSIGGEERLQFKNEIGGANGRFTPRDNNYQLLRSRVYADLWFRDLFRVYVEYLDAQSYNQDLPPLAIDQGHSQILNAFVDIKLASLGDNPVYGRVGRQELTYGSQRLVSPLDWANTRRTFDGAKIFYRSEQFDLDAWWTRPVFMFPGRFDSPDSNRQFAGIWGTYRPSAEQNFDLYYLYLDSDLPVAFGRSPGGRAGYDNNTVGARWDGFRRLSKIFSGLECNPLDGDLMWDVEGSYQFGDYSNRAIDAGFSSSGIGYAFNKLPMQPQFWAYFDYASGTPNRNGLNTDFATFNQQFPFGHYYFGYLDEVGRENIHDWNFQASVYPTKWITAWAQYHVFRLDQAQDALYGTGAGYPTVRFDPTGRAGTNVGQELDLAALITLDRHNQLLLGYSKFYSGDFIRQTGAYTNPELFYASYSFRW